MLHNELLGQDQISKDSREAKMVIVKTDENGKPVVWCDPEIADIVHALNKEGIATVASCSGHGVRPGVVSLKDGRELLVAPDYDSACVMEACFPGINGEPVKKAPAEVQRLKEENTKLKSLLGRVLDSSRGTSGRIILERYEESEIRNAIIKLEGE